MRKSVKIAITGLFGIAVASLGTLVWLVGGKEAEIPLQTLRGLRPYVHHPSGYIPQAGLARGAASIYHVPKPLAQCLAEADRDLLSKGWKKSTASPNFAAYYSKPITRQAQPGTRRTLFASNQGIAFFSGRKDWGAKPIPGTKDADQWTTIRVSGAMRPMSVIDRMRVWAEGLW